MKLEKPTLGDAEIEWIVGLVKNHFPFSHTAGLVRDEIVQYVGQRLKDWRRRRLVSRICAAITHDTLPYQIGTVSSLLHYPAHCAGPARL